MSDELIVQIEVIGTPGKNALYINGRRVAGSKPWGGGRTIEQWNVKQSELVNAIGNTQVARIAELEAALATAARVLHKAGKQFTAYANQNAAKGTADGDQKAATNQQWAQRCFNAHDAALTGGKDESVAD